jgi:hypothetical protein
MKKKNLSLYLRELKKQEKKINLKLTEKNNKVHRKINELETKKISLMYKQNWKTFSYTNLEKEKENSNKIRDEKGDITPDATEIQKIIRNYEQL